MKQHWGENFDYLEYDRSKGEIWQSIEAMDRAGMSLIESHNSAYALPSTFRRYLRDTGNTICGQNPIILLLSVLCTQLFEASSLSLRTSFVHYAQSNKVRSDADMSVSYAASVTLSLP